MKKLFILGILLLMTTFVSAQDFEPTAFEPTDAQLAGAGAMLAGMMIFVLISSLIVYIWTSLTTMIIAKRIGTPNPWLAWIPIANIYLLSQMAGMHWWTAILAIAGLILFPIPIIGWLLYLATIVLMFIWWYKIFERRGIVGWAAIVSLIIFPIFLIMLGVLAWKKDEE